jgi:hypothetical protein
MLLVGACCLVAVGGCGSDDDKTTQSTTTSPAGSGDGTSTLPKGSEPVTLDPADFTTNIDNPYFPLSPGSKWVYHEDEGDSVLNVTVTVTNATKKVQGITARVISDVVKDSKDGSLVEVTDDWYSQDSAGNVWYLGEDTKEYENGKVSSTKGSWEHGVDGAYAGIIMPAKPRVGQTYRQEYYKGEAEDQAQVLSVDAKAKVPEGSFDSVVRTKDFTTLDPKAAENKYYARGVGLVLTVALSSGGREELQSFTR